MRETCPVMPIRRHGDALSVVQALAIVLVCAIIVGLGSMVLPIG